MDDPYIKKDVYQIWCGLRSTNDLNYFKIITIEFINNQLLVKSPNYVNMNIHQI
jgi:hypothetical protein